MQTWWSANPATFVSLGNLRIRIPTGMFRDWRSDADPDDAKITGAILIGVLATTLLGICVDISSWPARDLLLAPSREPHGFNLICAALCTSGLFEIIFVFLFVDLFDNVGTLVESASKAGSSKTARFRGWAGRWCPMPWVRSSVRSRERPR